MDVEVRIPKEIYDKIKETEFESVDEYLTFVLKGKFLRAWRKSKSSDSEMLWRS